MNSEIYTYKYSRVQPKEREGIYSLVSSSRWSFPSFSTANVRIFQARRVLRDPSASKTGLVGPVVGVLSLPRPLDPAGALLVRDDLCLPVLPQERLVAGAERGRFAGDTIAAGDEAGAGVGSIITSADAAAVQVGRTISGGRSPLADDGPKIEGRQSTSVRTRGVDVLLVRP